MSAELITTQTPMGGRDGILLADGQPITGVNRFPGRKAIGVIRVAANVADTETVTIGGDVYEFDRAANGVTAGRIAVTGHADDTPANATDALIATINASGRESVTAVDISANEILLLSDSPGAVVLALAETMAGSNNVVSAAAMYGGAAAAAKRVATAVRVPNATEVALGNLHFGFDFTPTLVQVTVRTTSTGVVAAWDGATTISGTRVILDNTGSVDWATTSTIYLVAWE